MYYSPVRHSSARSKLLLLPFDLHVLSMPPAFNLSQDQTLQFNLARSAEADQSFSKLSNYLFSKILSICESNFIFFA